MSDRPLKILLVNASAYPAIGGVENSLRFIVSELLHLGHEVKIWCLKNELKLEESLIKFENIEIVKMEQPHIRWPHMRNNMRVRLAQTGIKKFIKEFKPDVIWSRSASIGLGAVLSGYQGPVFQIFSTNASMDAKGLYLNTRGMPVKRRITRLLLYPFHYFSLKKIEIKLLKNCFSIFFSKNMHDQMVIQYGSIMKNSCIINPGVNTNFYNVNHGKTLIEKIIATYKIDTSKKIILYVGRLSGAKNLYMLIDALGHVKSDFFMIFVGSGNDEDRIKSYVDNRNLSSRIFFVGQQNELLPAFYTLADVTVLPTTVESFGQIYLESMACGTPVVGFCGDSRKVITATNEIVKDGITGRIVNDISPKGLSAGIDDILHLSERDYQTFSSNAVQDVKERYSWHSFVSQMLELTRKEING
jgi:1,2-diacylglycerol 3-alpha-glucosyltransferase